MGALPPAPPFNLNAKNSLMTGQKSTTTTTPPPHTTADSAAAKAAQLFKLAANKGHASALFHLGYMLFHGSGVHVPRDRNESVRLFKLAAEAGDASAQFHLGYIYENGVHVAPGSSSSSTTPNVSATTSTPLQNLQEAARLYKLAANQGHHTAEYILAKLYQKLVSFIPNASPLSNSDLLERFPIHTSSAGSGKGLPISHIYLEEAIRLLNSASRHGNSNAQLHLGQMYAKGVFGVDRDINEAIRLLMLAAANGHKHAPALLKSIQQLYLQNGGVGVVRESVGGGNSAAKLTTPAAATTSASSSSSSFIRSSRSADTTTTSSTSSSSYLTASQHFTLGENYLVEFFKNGCASTFENAYHHLIQASGLGSALASEKMGSLYEKGQGTLKPNMELALRMYKLASQQGSSNSSFILASRYQHGEHVPQDFSQAAHYYQLAHVQGHSGAQFLLASLYLTQAAELYQSTVNGGGGAGNRGNISVVDIEESHRILGIFNHSGIGGFKKSLKAANQHYIQSSSSPSSSSSISQQLDSLYKLALSYEFEGGEEEDTDNNISTAMKLYTLCAEGGHAKSQYRLGVIYEMGSGSPFATSTSTANSATNKDLGLAVKWLTLAAKNGLVNAQFKLDMLNGNIDGGNGVNVSSLSTTTPAAAVAAAAYSASTPQITTMTTATTITSSPTSASPTLQTTTNTTSPLLTTLRQLQLASDQGDAQAQLTLGRMYQHGQGGVIKRDLVMAVKLYTAASSAMERGGNNNISAQARFQLAEIYKNGGMGVSRNREKSQALYKRACEQGLADAQYVVGLDCEVMQRDFVSACRLYQLASAQGHSDAQYRLGRIYENGGGGGGGGGNRPRGRDITISRDYKRASILYQQSAFSGNPDAQYALARLYEEGPGVPIDFVRARELYKQAAESGHHASAMFRLGRLIEFGLGGEENKDEAWRLYRLASAGGDMDAQFKLVGSFFMKLSEGRGQKSENITI